MAAKRGPKVDKEKQTMFAIWWATPKSKRQPKTIDQWCELNDVAQSTTWRWRQDLGFRQEVTKLRLEIAEDSMGDIINALTNEAKGGDLNHAKFLMELMGDYVPTSHLKHQVDTGSSGANGLSQDMIDFVAEELIEHSLLSKYSIKEDEMREALTDILMEEE